jgi:hypothetical protein
MYRCAAVTTSSLFNIRLVLWYCNVRIIRTKGMRGGCLMHRLDALPAQNGSPVAIGSTKQLPLGRHIITYVAKDANGNEAQVTTVVNVLSGIVF